MSLPSVSDLLSMRSIMLRKSSFVPSGPAASGGQPGGAPMDPAAAGGAPPMDPAAMGGAPPMDPAAMGGAPMDPAAAGGAPPMDPSMMMAPDGTNPFPGGGEGGGEGKGTGSKVKAEDVVLLIQLAKQMLGEIKLQRDLLLDMMKQMNLQISPDTPRSSVASAGDLADPSAGATGTPMM